MRFSITELGYSHNCYLNLAFFACICMYGESSVDGGGMAGQKILLVLRTPSPHVTVKSWNCRLQNY